MPWLKLKGLYPYSSGTAVNVKSVGSSYWHDCNPICVSDIDFFAFLLNLVGSTSENSYFNGNELENWRIAIINAIKENILWKTSVKTLLNPA